MATRTSRPCSTTAGTGAEPSPLDVLSGVAVAHSNVREWEKRREARARDDEAWAPRHRTPAPAARPVSFRAPIQSQPQPQPNLAPPPAPTSLGRRPFPSVLSLPPPTSGLARRPVHGVYMQSDAQGRAVAHLNRVHHRDKPALASLLLPTSTPLMPPVFPSLNPPHAHSAYGTPPDASFFYAHKPASGPMARRPPPNLRLLSAPNPSSSSTPQPKQPAHVSSTASTAASRLSPQSSDPPREQRQPRDTDPTPVPLSQPGRRASVATRAAFEPSEPTKPSTPSKRGSAPLTRPPIAQKDPLLGVGKKNKAANPSFPRPELVAPPQPAPPDERGRNPIVSCTLWEDERTVVMQVLIEGHVVARRADNDWVNSTKLLNMVVGMTRGKRDMYLKNEPERIVFRRGALHLKGVWIPLPAAVEHANNYGLTDFLYPLFEPNIRSFLFRPINQERTTQLVVAASQRAALVAKPGPGTGLSEELREELRIRGEELEKLLTFLEEGLGMREPSGGATSVEPADEEDEADLGGFEHGEVVPASVPASPVGARLLSPSSSSSSSSLGSNKIAADRALDPPSPPTPPPTGGLSLPSTKEQQQQQGRGLAASYRTRFDFPADGPSLRGDSMSSTSAVGPSHKPTAGTITRTGPASLSSFLIDSASATAAPPLARQHAAPPTAYEAQRRPSFSWFDNPTPPADADDDACGDMREYFALSASPVMMRRQSISHERSATVSGYDMALGALGALEEAPQVVAAGQPSLAGCASTPLIRPEGVELSYEPTSTMWRDTLGRSLSLPATLQLSGGDSAGCAFPFTPFNDPSPREEVAPVPAEDYQSLVAQLRASLCTPPPPAHPQSVASQSQPPSALSRFSATRMSIDSALDHILVGPETLRAPQPEPGLARADEQEERDQALLRELLGGGGGGARRGSSGTESLSNMDISPVVDEFPDLLVLGGQDGVAPAASSPTSGFAFPAAHDSLGRGDAFLQSAPAGQGVLKRPCDDIVVGDVGSVGTDGAAGMRRAPKKARFALDG